MNTPDKIYIGIDPGDEGAMCLMWQGRIDILCFKDASPYKIADTIKHATELAPVMVAIEDVHSMPGQGISSTFKFGYNVGIVTGLLIAYCVPYVTVRPQEWQKEVWNRQDKVKKSDGKTDTKKTSFNAARRLYPDQSLLRTHRCRTPHDGMADALLICEYARRKNL